MGRGFRWTSRAFVALSLLLCGVGSLPAKAQTIVTLGNGFFFFQPAGIALDHSGNVFVGEPTGNTAVYEILAAGGYATVNKLVSDPAVATPGGVAVDGNDNLFVADAENNAVYEFLAAGGYVTRNTLGSGFKGPSGVAVDGNGNVFVADTGNNAVKEILAAGNYVTVNTLGSGFNGPIGVAIDGNGNVFVADTGNNAVKEILAAGNYVTVNTLGGGFNGPTGVAVDGSDNAYVADRGNGAVKVILAAGGYATVRSVGSGFRTPTGVAVDGSGDVFVADYMNSAVEEILGGTTSVQLAAAVLPESRSVQVGVTATAFATLINAGTTTASTCTIAPLTTVSATFLFQTTNPATNALTGTPNTAVSIPAGGSQSFLLAFKPTAPFAPTDVVLTFDCANLGTAPSIVGVDTLNLSASGPPVPDIVAVAASGDPGYVDIPSATGTGVFAVATINLGSTSPIIATVGSGAVDLPAVMLICSTNPVTGAGYAPPAANVTTTIPANANPTFGIFVTGSAVVPNLPGVNRAFVSFADAGGVLRGQTSVAVRTQ